MYNSTSILKGSLVYFLFFLCLSNISFAQQSYSFKKVTAEQVLGRLGVMHNVNNFGRLPSNTKELVRTPVWNLGENSAGLYVDFKTNSPSIIVKYKVKGPLSMPHMPSIGVSGIDLYFHNTKSHTWEWAFGNYQFKDTISYTFTNIDNNLEGVFRLYLPLYNSVEFMEIGVQESSTFTFVDSRPKPIVIYGTSIAQGACASRPGMGWTNILGRDFSNEVINLAFSGNGRLEKPILDLIANQEASVYILDCIPNLSITSGRSVEQLDSLIISAVEYIRSKRPLTPIVLTEHSSAYTPGFMNINKVNEYNASTEVAQKSFTKLKKQGVKNIYWLSSKDIGLDINSTVDYAHPNDVGMMKIAKAYQKLLNKIVR